MVETTKVLALHQNRPKAMGKVLLEIEAHLIWIILSSQCHAEGRS